MKRILYVSAASAAVTDADIADILAASRRNNIACGMTGMLLHLDGNFLQILEGPEAPMEETFARIAADGRHRHVTLLWSEAAAERNFPDWSMGFERVTEGDPRWSGAFRIDPRGAAPVATAGPEIIALMRTFYDTASAVRFA